jgi:hypothetical protein
VLRNPLRQIHCAKSIAPNPLRQIHRANNLRILAKKKKTPAAAISAVRGFS